MKSPFKYFTKLVKLKILRVKVIIMLKSLLSLDVKLDKMS